MMVMPNLVEQYFLIPKSNNMRKTVSELHRNKLFIAFLIDGFSHVIEDVKAFSHLYNITS